MLLEFEPTHSETKKYNIIRDYFVSNGKIQGIYFLVQDLQSKEVKQIFLDKEDINNSYLPKKTKTEDEDNIRLKANGVESGNENVLIIEKGFWKKKNKMNKVIGIPAKKYRFILT